MGLYELKAKCFDPDVVKAVCLGPIGSVATGEIQSIHPSSRCKISLYHHTTHLSMPIMLKKRTTRLGYRRLTLALPIVVARPSWLLAWLQTRV